MLTIRGHYWTWVVEGNGLDGLWDSIRCHLQGDMVVFLFDAHGIIHRFECSLTVNAESIVLTTQEHALQRHNTEIRNKYSQQRHCAATVSIPTFMFLWAIYVFLGSVCLFCCRKIGGPDVGINRSLQTHDCGNWDWGRAISFLGIHKSKFLCSVGLNVFLQWRLRVKF